jgi:hypothetical protein
LHFAHYNFVRPHSTLRMTPAMAAGVTPTLSGLFGAGHEAFVRAGIGG